MSWYYVDASGAASGPVDTADLADCAIRGEVNDETLVRTADGPLKFRRLATFRDIRDAVAARRCFIEQDPSPAPQTDATPTAASDDDAWYCEQKIRQLQKPCNMYLTLHALRHGFSLARARITLAKSFADWDDGDDERGPLSKRALRKLIDQGFVTAPRLIRLGGVTQDLLLWPQLALDNEEEVAAEQREDREAAEGGDGDGGDDGGGWEMEEVEWEYLDDDGEVQVPHVDCQMLPLSSPLASCLSLLTLLTLPSLSIRLSAGPLQHGRDALVGEGGAPRALAPRECGGR